MKFSLPNAAAPRVVLLPDAAFFVRVLPLSSDTAAADVPAQVELALEAMAPFPVAQLFYGWWAPAGASRVLVFASYRKRFAADEVGAWGEAELVAPAFIAALGLGAPGVSVTLPGRGATTTLRWDDASGVPASVTTVIHPVVPPLENASASAPAAADDAPEAPAATVAWGGQNELEFTLADGRTSTLDLAAAASLDVRDKDDLAHRRRAARRDHLLWRVCQASAAALLLLLLGEGALVGLRWAETGREARVRQQQPQVDRLATQNNLAIRIDELSTKRLRPFEMIALVDTKRPRTVQFLKTTTQGLYVLEVDAQTMSGTDVAVYQSALRELPTLEKVEIRDPQARDNLTRFTLVVTFKPEAFRPVPAAAPEVPPADATATSPVAAAGPLVPASAVSRPPAT